MKKLFIILFTVVALFAIGSQTESVDHYLCTNGPWQYYLDDTYIIKEGTKWCKIRVFTRRPGDGRTIYASIGYESKGKWLYDIQGNVYSCSYNNFSGYARDWLVSRGYF